MGEMTNRDNFIRYQLPLLLWGLLIAISSSIPGAAFPQVSHWWIPKIVHVIYFFFFCFFVYRALKHQNFVRLSVNACLVLSLGVTLIYALLDESHQILTAGRHPSMTDVLIDTVSASLFVVPVWISGVVQQKQKDADPA
jgi:VanZ family protein